MSAKIRGEDLHAEVERIAEMGDRRTGTDVEHRVMEYLRGRFAEIGLRNAAIEWFDMHWWNPLRSELHLLPEGEPIQCKPIWYTGSTPAGGLTGECVYCGYGMPQQFGSASGKIAVIDCRTLLHFWPTYRFFESYKYALSSGAKALVVIIDTPGDLIPIFTAEEERHDNPMPAVLVSRSGGAHLKERMGEGKTEVRLLVEAESRMSRTGDVVATLPGKTGEYIIVGAHHDSIYKGAVDNAAGLAALLALASEFASHSEPPEKNIIFATHPGHELLVGAREFILKRADVLPKTAVYVTLDGIGCDNYEEQGGKIVKTGRDEARGIFISPNRILADIIFPITKKHRLHPSAFLPADVMCPNEDLEGRFFEAGVPIIDIIGKPIWYHTEEDTPDKCTPDQLERGTLAHLEIIEKIDAMPASEIRAADRKLSDPSVLMKPTSTTAKPSIDFTHLPDRLVAGEPVLIHVTNFQDQEGVLVDMQWDIAGEEGSKGPVLLHVFDAPGKYEVGLTVTNDLGAQGKNTKTFEVV